MINIERVDQRVKLGGHDVTKEKIESRYSRTMDLLLDATTNTYRTFIFDNSGKAPILILELFMGREVRFLHSEIPKWVDRYLLLKR